VAEEIGREMVQEFEFSKTVCCGSDVPLTVTVIAPWIGEVEEFGATLNGIWTDVVELVPDVVP
jgi:hypothetical protein